MSPVWVSADLTTGGGGVQIETFSFWEGPNRQNVAFCPFLGVLLFHRGGPNSKTKKIIMGKNENLWCF